MRFDFYCPAWAEYSHAEYIRLFRRVEKLSVVSEKKANPFPPLLMPPLKTTLRLDNICSFEDRGSILCKYFLNSVLPKDKSLQALLNDLAQAKKCCICHTPISAGSNRQKYCCKCAETARKKQNASSARKRRVERRKIGALEEAKSGLFYG